MKSDFQNFLIIKKIVFKKESFNVKYEYCFINDLIHYLEINKYHSLEANRLIISRKNFLLWIKSIKLSDFKVLEFVHSNFFDDLNYCNEILENYFTKKASEIKILN